MYLGASALFRGERTEAVTSFRTLVLENPRLRPDSLVFPPRVTQVFSEVLQTTKAVAVTAEPSRQSFTAGAGAFVARVYASSSHRIVASLLSPSGREMRPLYDGRIADSLTITWSGLDDTGAAAPGRYHLQVASLVTEDTVLRRVRLPLEVAVEPADTLPWPEAPSPGRRGGPDLRYLIPGVVVGGALALPALFGSVSAEGIRITLGVAVGALGVAGALQSRGPSDAAQAATEAEWNRQVQEVTQENRRRRARPRIVVQAGAVERLEGGAR